MRRFPLFVTERDAYDFLDLCDYVTSDIARWTVVSYCLMPNHVHLVVDSSVEQLSLAMHRLNGLYAQRFNRTHGYRGHVFQERYHAKPILDDAHLPGSIRYVVLNPVRAGLCSHPRQWRWSSYRALAGLEAARRFLDRKHALSFFGANRLAATRSFIDFVDDGIAAARDGMGTVPGTVPGFER